MIKFAIISINKSIEKNVEYQDYIILTYRSNIEAVEKTTYYFRFRLGMHAQSCSNVHCLSTI
jgi:hypothetical protein